MLRVFQLLIIKIFASLCLILSNNSFAVEHTVFDGILKQYVALGRVDYARMHLASMDDLRRYLNLISETKLEALNDLPNSQQLAFYINAYNAFTILTVLDHWPIKSIRDIPNVWKEKKYKLVGRLVSLDQIEHEYVRTFDEPRVHFALNCASIGCPDLRSEAYTAQKLSNQLEDQTRLFFDQPDKFYYCADCKDIKLSKIFKWFSSDFKDSTHSSFRKYGKFNGVVSFIYKYVGSIQKKRIKSQKIALTFLEYDWALNSRIID
tara:strand:- start:2608 stop:3396 length:789 start_codon:yes stop_codon:yes gene_type:complete